MIKKSIIRKYVAILAFAVSAIVFVLTACTKDPPEEEEPVTPDRKSTRLNSSH